MAAHDAAPYIAQALASVCGQSVDDLEVIVVDDGSTDSTARVVELEAHRDPRVRLLRLGHNRGQAAALNVGAGEARGHYLAILDADDEATANRLELQLSAMAHEPALVLVGGAIETWRDWDGAAGAVWRYAADDAAIRVRNLFKSEFISGAMTFDRERLPASVLHFDERLRLGVDWASSFEAMRRGSVANVGSIVMRYRVHAGQLTTGMMDGLGSDSTRLRAEYLAWLGVQPSDDELRTHLAVSPCNYWLFGAHPYFRARRRTIAGEASRWFDRLKGAAARSGRVSTAALGDYLDEIGALIVERLAAPEVPSLVLPVASPRGCVTAQPETPGCCPAADPPRKLAVASSAA